MSPTNCNPPVAAKWLLVALVSSLGLSVSAAAGQERKPDPPAKPGVTTEKPDAAAPSPTRRASAKRPSHLKDHQLEVYRLKYADVSSLASMLAEVAPQARISVGQDPKTMIVLAPPEEQAAVREFIEKTDLPPQKSEEEQLKVFQIVNADPAVLLEAISEIFDSDRIRLAVDPRTNAILAKGPERDLNIVEAILLRLDEQAGRELARPQAFRVRVVWLASGLSSEEAAEPAADLKEVLVELRKVGVDGLRQVGQVMVMTLSGSDFEVSCAPMLGETRADTEINGRLQEAEGVPYLNIDISGSRLAYVPLPTPTEIRPGPNRVQRAELVARLATEIVAPCGQYVVLGVTPAAKMTSVFVVQVTPGEK